jgi:WD repeat-containing protein 19
MQVGDVLRNITSPKLHLMYAKAREADGAFDEAATAYENAREFESAIRIHLNNLHDPDQAVRIVKVCSSS